MAGAAARAKAAARRVPAPDATVAPATVASQTSVETEAAGSVQTEPADVGPVSVR
ncbi:hypothetical protein QFZ23_001113 [Arthrobacter globiformis]|nr:hypothetical protein [Arthrobacter globiformis]